MYNYQTKTNLNFTMNEIKHLIESVLQKHMIETRGFICDYKQSTKKVFIKVVLSNFTHKSLHNNTKLTNEIFDEINKVLPNTNARLTKVIEYSLRGGFGGLRVDVYKK